MCYMPRSKHSRLIYFNLKFWPAIECPRSRYVQNT
jgi:hypothetical protein